MNSLRIYNPQQVSNTVTSLQLLTARFCFRTWDICGQDLFHSLIDSFYKRANLTILVYSIDDRESFEALDFWLGEIRTYARKINKIVLVGNKKDIDRENRKVSYEEGNEFYMNNQLDMFFEASAKEGLNSSENIYTKC